MIARGARRSTAILLWVSAFQAVAQSPSAPTSITLQSAYQQALARSEDTRIAQQNLAQSQVAQLSTWVPISPQAVLSGSGTLQNAVTGSQIPQVVAAEASLLQPVFRRGFFAAREAAQLGIEAATFSLDRARQQVMLEVTTSFVAVLRSRQAVLVVDAAVQRGEAQEASANARVQAGGALRTAQLQATISLRQARVEKVRVSREVTLQELSFERLVGIKPPPTLTLPSTPPLPNIEQATRLAAERSDLLALQRQALSARALEQSLGGARWPRLDFKFAYDQSYPTLVGTAPYTVQAAALLTVPLFQGGDEFLRVEAQRVVAEVASLRVTRLEKQIAEQLRSALNELDAAQQSFALAEQQIKDAQENYALVTNQFKLRTVTFLEVAAAQSALTDAENLRLISNFDRELAAYRLLFAIGTLQL